MICMSVLIVLAPTLRELFAQAAVVDSDDSQTMRMASRGDWSQFTVPIFEIKEARPWTCLCTRCLDVNLESQIVSMTPADACRRSPSHLLCALDVCRRSSSFEGFHMGSKLKGSHVMGSM